MAGVGLGQLLLALDATLVSLADAPRGLDLPVSSAALIGRSPSASTDRYSLVLMEVVHGHVLQHGQRVVGQYRK